MKKVAIIDKCPSKTDYSEWFKFPFDHFHMSSSYIKKLIKKDVDLVIDLDEYDLVILVGSEAAKEYAKVSSVTNMAGKLVNEKFIPIINPAMLLFKPEGRPAFLKSVERIESVYSGEYVPVEGDFKGILKESEAVEFLEELIAAKPDIVAWDTETTALYTRDGYVLGIGLAYKLKHGRYIHSDCITDKVYSLLERISTEFKKVFHNVKFDRKMLRYHFNLFEDTNIENYEDTMLLHYDLDENNAHGLKPLALQHTDYGDYDKELVDFKKKYCKEHNILEQDFTYDLVPFDTLSVYGAMDPAVTLELYYKFKPLVEKSPKLNKVYRDILMKGTFFLEDIEEEGIPLDKDRLLGAYTYLDKEIQESRANIYKNPEVSEFEKVQGDIFNPGSSTQLRKLLFDYIGLNTPGKLTKGGSLSTDEEVLTSLSEQHRLPGDILKFRKLIKIQNSYVTKILPEIDLDGKIRTGFNIINTTSGRLSSSGKFNAQQMPREDPIIKGCIVAPPGYKVLSQDLQTGEVYVAAVLSGDKKLQEIFKNQVADLHSMIAHMVFGMSCKPEEVKEQYPVLRQAAKAIS